MSLRDTQRRLAQRLTRHAGEAALPRRVVFVHIPKAAGSSIHQFFQTRLGGTWRAQAVMLDDRSPTARVALARGARYAGGHFGARLLDRIRGDALAFTVLRDPLDRMLSAWRFAQTVPAGAALQIYGSLEAALVSGDPAVRQSFDNVIARQLAVAFDLDLASDVPRDEWTGRAAETLARLDRVIALPELEAAFPSLCVEIGVAHAPLPRENVTEDAARRNRTDTAPVPDVKITPALLDAAGPYLDLDRAVVAPWFRDIPAHPAGPGTPAS